MKKLIVKNNLKDVVKSLEEESKVPFIQSVSKDFSDALEGEVEDLIKKALNRAKSNGRKTLQPRDL